jgi:hypothetical protein
VGVPASPRRVARPIHLNTDSFRHGCAAKASLSRCNPDSNGDLTTVSWGVPDVGRLLTPFPGEADETPSDEQEETVDPQHAASALMRLINGYQISQVIHVAAMLGIADLLKDGPRASADIANATSTHPSSMYRLLHALASASVLEERADARFALTDIGQCLRSDSPQPRVAWARYVGRPYVWQSWGGLLHSVTTGEDAFRHLHGSGVWDWRAKHPNESRDFDAAMTELSSGVVETIAAALDFSQWGCIVDVGGGQGAFLAGILAIYPMAKGILFDLPHVVAGAPAVLRAHGVTDRCQTVGGDMFTAVPPGGDAYVVKNVLMDEDDAEVCAILRACRACIGTSGRLIVIERLLTDPNRSEINLSDVTMLVMTGGRERTLSEFTALFAEAGFHLEQSVATRSPSTLLIGAPS